MNKYEEIRDRFGKGYVTKEQLKKFVELGVITEEQEQTILNLTQVQVIPHGIYRGIALAFGAESMEKGEGLSANAGYFAGEYAPWQPGETYRPGQLLQHEGAALQVRQPVTAQAHQPPFSAGMTAIYIPYLVPDEYGVKPYKYGCATKRGERFYGGQGAVFAYIGADNPSCIYPPSEEYPALWQREE